MALTCDTHDASIADSASSSLPVTTQRAPTSRPTACSTELAPPAIHQHNDVITETGNNNNPSFSFDPRHLADAVNAHPQP